jgi:uncharacterized protein (DUF1778 family)
MSPQTVSRQRSERLEARITAEEKALIEQAVAVLGQDKTSFIVSELVIAAQRVLADQEEFALTEAQSAAWDDVNSRPARSLAGIGELLARPSPFSDR